MAKLKSTHGFRVGDIVMRKDGFEGKYVVCGTQGWVHGSWRNTDGTINNADENDH